MREKETEPRKGMAFKGHPALNTILIDHIQVLERSDNRLIIRFFSELPEGVFEQSRIAVDKKLFLGFLENTCRTFDVYPKPAKGNKQKKTTTKISKVHQ